MEENEPPNLEGCRTMIYLLIQSRGASHLSNHVVTLYILQDFDSASQDWLGSFVILDGNIVHLDRALDT